MEVEEVAHRDIRTFVAEPAGALVIAVHQGTNLRSTFEKGMNSAASGRAGRVG